MYCSMHTFVVKLCIITHLQGFSVDEMCANSTVSPREQWRHVTVPVYIGLIRAHFVVGKSALKRSRN